MEAIDFSRSHFTFRIDRLKKAPKTLTHKPRFTLNNARIPIDCRCEITDKQTGESDVFVLGVSCKTERVGVERDIWIEPNADFVPIFSKDKFMHLKTYDRVGREMLSYPPVQGVQPERLVVSIEDTFDSVQIDFSRCEGETLETADEIIEATLANHPLIARTEIEADRYVAVIDYPVKTINANERDKIYQTDTGPVLLPDLSLNPEDLLEGLELAFSAFNAPHWTEFIVRVATPITDDISVYHYAQPVRFETKNQMIRLTESLR